VRGETEDRDGAGRYRFVGEIGKVTIEMWIFADWGEWGYCSVVWSSTR